MMRVNEKAAFYPDVPLLSDKSLDDESAALAHVAHGLSKLLALYHETLQDTAQWVKDKHPASAATINKKAHTYLNYVVQIQRFSDRYVYEAHQRCLKDRTR